MIVITHKPGLKDRSDAGAGGWILGRRFGPKQIDGEKRDRTYAKQASRSILAHDQAKQTKEKQECTEGSQHCRLLRGQET
jgi:hypothetical protein